MTYSKRTPFPLQWPESWKRTTWRDSPKFHEGHFSRVRDSVIYRADPDAADGSEWRPSIFMPRWASRITLSVVSVRVERLHDITEEDAKREGVAPRVTFGKMYPSKRAADIEHRSYRGGFEDLWGAINGTDSWKANPWVWRVEFTRSTTPADARTGEG